MTKEDEEQGKAPSVEVTEEPKTEEPKTEEQKEDLTELVTKIKTGYEEKLAKQKQEFESRLKEREAVITQLLNGESTEEEETIADKINKRRENYLKKW